MLGKPLQLLQWKTKIGGDILRSSIALPRFLFFFIKSSFRKQVYPYGRTINRPLVVSNPGFYVYNECSYNMYREELLFHWQRLQEIANFCSTSTELPVGRKGTALVNKTSAYYYNNTSRTNRFFSTDTGPPRPAYDKNYDHPDWWKSDPRAQQHKAIERKNLKVGPYKRGRIFVHPKEDPQEFVLCVLIILVTLYTIFTLSPGESYKSRRNRVIRQRLYNEYGLTEADVDEIEGTEIPLSNDLLRDTE